MNYLSYTLQIHDYLMEFKYLLQPYNSSQQISAWTEDIDRLNEKLETMRFQVVVVGEFNRGKTSFINALLRKQILPADVVPATATINRITYGNIPSSYICWNNGKPDEKVDIENLSHYITKLTESSANNAKYIKEAVVKYPCRFCQNNVDIIDTPGMNESDAMNNVTINQLADIDLAIVLLDPNAPVSNTEARFIAQLTESEQIDQIIFVVSKIDTIYSADNRERILNKIRERLQSLVRSALLDNHSDNDPVMDKFDRIFTSPIIFSVSNTKALYAYETGDREALEESGFLKLNNELPSLIIRSQHNATIINTLNSIISMCQEFFSLLQNWEAKKADTERYKIIKKSFAEVAYDFAIDKNKITKVNFEMLDRLCEAQCEDAASCIIDFESKFRTNRDMLVTNLKALFKSLNEKLMSEEQNFYQKIRIEYIYPQYLDLCHNLYNIVRPDTDISKQIEPMINELLKISHSTEFISKSESFYWEKSPLPPDNTPKGQIAYMIRRNVKESFYIYYNNRKARLVEFIDDLIKVQEEKISKLVKSFFSIVNSTFSETEFISVESNTIDNLNFQLDQLVERCKITKENYIKEAEY